jgi:hypothetical protein
MSGGRWQEREAGGFGAELRALRRSLGLSLGSVEAKSDGTFSAVVIGSWERGDRRVAVSGARALLAFYGDYRLPILGPGDVVYGGALDDTTTQWVVVGPGGTVINAESRGHAQVIAATWDDSHVGYQLTGPITYVEES